MSTVATSLAVLPHKGNVFRTRRRLQKAHPARYQKVVVRGEYVCLYTSDEPSTAVSEGWLDWLVEHNIPLESVVVFVEEAEHLLTVVIEHGAVSDIHVMPHDEWANVTAIQTLWFGESAPSGFEGEVFDKVVMIGPALRKVTPLPLVGTGLAVVFMAAWLVWSQSAPAPESTTATVTIDPFEAYRQRMTQGISAHQRLDATSKLWAVAQSLPPGWEATRVEGEGKSVTLRFHRNPTGLMQTMDEWTSRYSKWAPYLSFDMQGGQIQLVMKPDLQHWAHQTVTVAQSQAWLSDVLNLAGIAPVSTQKNKESASITLDMNTLSPSQWSVVADVSQQVPTLAERVNFQIGEAGTLSGPLTLTLYGESK